ncbi:Mediator of RNA polymerase II transcription subunit 7b, partial [Dichanthelium oligosanthes]
LAMTTSSAYPPPPPFYQLYKDYEQDPSSVPEPPPLIPLIDGKYVTFGTEHKTNELLPSLESHNARQLYPNGPNIDLKKDLRTLNRELQLHILELADILLERPSQYACRIEDISLILRNLHHLLNSLRPHQARATLIHMLESQIQRRKQAIEDIRQ